MILTVIVLAGMHICDTHTRKWVLALVEGVVRTQHVCKPNPFAKTLNGSSSAADALQTVLQRGQILQCN